MENLLAILIGVFFGLGVYFILEKTLLKLIFGLVMFGHAANLLIFTAAGLSRGVTPIIGSEAAQLTAPYPDPLPQALILTAIVIGFGVLAFVLVLTRQACVMNLQPYDCLEEEGA